MRNGLLILLLLVSGACYPKTEYPEWMNDDYRDKTFPSSTYYCGYVIAEMGKDDAVEETLDRLRQSAYGKLLSQISVTIQHSASDNTKEVVGGNDAYSENVYSSSTQLSTRMTEIPGIEVKTFADVETRMAAVFAYVKKDGLAAKFQRQLIAQITRLNVRLEDAEGYLNSSNKTKARETLADARTILKSAEDTRNTMSAIDSRLTADDLMETEWRAAEMKIIELEKELNRSVKLALKCLLDDEGENTLKRTLSGELYRRECEVVDTVERAEWFVEVKAKVEPYNTVQVGGIVNYFSFATAIIKITDTNGNVAYSDELRCKGAHTKSYDNSSADALRKVAVRISEIVKNTVQK
ncbi:MAG: hypothetical protein MJ002_00485 [Paludibacteraceae bacterium]|nr:hypothetical protein [Paludibacteraceae bacterium]